MSIFIFIKNVIQLILSPGNAWKDIDRSEATYEEVVSRGLYPLMAIMLLTVFVRPLYGLMHFEIINLLQVALVQFIAVFVALYVGRYVMSHFLPFYNSTGENDPIAVDNVAAYGTGLLVSLQILLNLLPVEHGVLLMLPLVAAVPIWKADKYLDVEPAGELKFMLMAVSALVLPVILINVLMPLLIN